MRIHEPYAGHEAVGTMAADFEVEKTSMYIQDKWFVNDDLTVMFGLRYDAVETPTAPPTNINFVKEYGFSNSSKFDFELLQPRFSSIWMLLTYLQAEKSRGCNFQRRKRLVYG